MPLREQVTIGPRGVRLLAAFARYIRMHGNVTKAATAAATLIRELCGDDVDPQWDIGSGVTFEGRSPQAELEAALAALTVSKRDSAKGDGSSSSDGKPK